MTAQTAEIQPTSPETLPQFLTLLLKGMLKRLPVKLLIAGGIALLAWILHTYLLVVSNEGFAPGTNPWLDRILALQGQAITGTLVWTLAAGLVTSFIARIITYGFGNTVRSAVETPRHILNWAAELGLLAIPLLVVGYISTIFLGFLINNSLLIVQLWLVVLGILIARHTSILLTILRLAWSDVQRLAKREKPAPFNLAWPGMYFVGVLIGLLAILPNNGILPYVCGCLGFLLVILISAGIFVRSQGGTERLIGKKVLFWILPPALLLAFLAATPVFADDGGWAEAGGTFGSWISSPGAFRAVAMGILPAAGAGAGVLVGTALGSMVSIIGAAGVPTAAYSLRPSAPGTTVSGRTTPPPRTADAQVENLQQPEQISTDPSRTADHQVESFQQQEKADSGTLSSRHKPGEGADTAGADTTDSEAAAESGIGLRSERADQDIAVQSRTAEGAAETGTGQRDVRGVQPQPGSEAGSTSGTAADSAGRVQEIERDTPAGQSMPDRHRPDVPDRTEDPLSERHRPGGLAEQEAESGRLVSRERPGGMADTDATPGPTAERHTSDAPTAERHQPGGMAEDVQAKPAAIEQPGLKAERHTPDVESGPTAERHTPAIEGGPTAERHDPDVVDKGTLQARRMPAEDTGLTAERFTGEETGPLHGRHQPVQEPELPLPPLPVPGYALDWELMVVRTPEDSGVTLEQRFELKERTRIGRHGAIDIKLLDPKVSRQHADITVEGSTCRIIDLDSSNGTFVNGRRLTGSAELKHGDAIKIGDTYFMVQQKAE